MAKVCPDSTKFGDKLGLKPTLPSHSGQKPSSAHHLIELMSENGPSGSKKRWVSKNETSRTKQTKDVQERKNAKENFNLL